MQQVQPKIAEPEKVREAVEAETLLAESVVLEQLEGVFEETAAMKDEPRVDPVVSGIRNGMIGGAFIWILLLLALWLMK